MKNILCFGDSNTYGANPNNMLRWPWGVRWTSILQSLLGEEYHITENGLSGRTTVFEDPITPGRSGIKELPYVLEAASPLDLVIVMLGTNDTKSYFSASAPVIAMGAGKIVECIQDIRWYNGFSRPEILLVSPILIDEGCETASGCISFDTAAPGKSRGFALEYEQVAKVHGVHYFNAASVACAGIDCVHMDAPAHKALADALAVKVREILG